MTRIHLHRATDEDRRHDGAANLRRLGERDDAAGILRRQRSENLAEERQEVPAVRPRKRVVAAEGDVALGPKLIVDRGRRLEHLRSS